jgi:outer membrane protein TolC
MRTTEPLTAFGFLLRQRGVTPAAFAPTTLNFPAPISNVGTGVVVEQPLFDAGAALGLRAAGAAHEAAVASDAYAHGASKVAITRAYYGAVLTTERITTLAAARSAADAHVRQAEAAFQAGTVTKSDVLLAQVGAGNAASALESAQADAHLARLGLALAMGVPGDTAWTLPDSLPPAQQVRALGQQVLVDTTSAARRGDVRAAQLQRTAAEVGARRAEARYLPQVAGFGRLDWNTPSAPFGGRDSWTVGVLVSWVPFAGAADIGDVRTAAAHRAEARAAADEAEATARLEREATRTALATAVDRLGIAETAVAQSAEAHRIVTRKYDGGLATIAELLDAASAETSARLNFAAARETAIVTAADRRQALGADISVLTTLDAGATP